MDLAGQDGCLCGIPGCPRHEVIGGRIFMENHPLGPIIIESSDWPNNGVLPFFGHGVPQF